MRSSLKRLLRRIVPGWLRDYRARRFRSRVTSATLAVVERSDGVVFSGLFSGMKYVETSYSSQLAPKLMGSYELELHDIIRYIASDIRPEVVVDVGAAEGYYAVGLALLLPRSLVIAFELNPKAREVLARLSDLNATAERITIEGRCDAVSLERSVGASQGCVVLMDVEGEELKLLDLAAVPSLRHAFILVELHPHVAPDVKHIITHRFSASHQVVYIEARDRRPADIPSLSQLEGVDRLAAAWEARSDEQGWLWLTPRSYSRDVPPENDGS